MNHAGFTAINPTRFMAMALMVRLSDGDKERRSSIAGDIDKQVSGYRRGGLSDSEAVDRAIAAFD